MKQCLRCQKDFEEKRETAKFCSTSCRVMHHRLHGKTKGVTPVQIQVLYNAMLGFVEKMQLGVPVIPLGSRTASGVVTEYKPAAGVKPPKTIAQYFEAKRECTCEDDYHRWVAEVDADPYLNSKQKQLLKTTNPSNL